MIQNIKFILGSLWIAFFAVSCNDMRKEIEVDMQDAAPKLVVSAMMQDSAFTITVSSSIPFTSKVTEVKKLKNLKTKLYEDGILLCEITEYTEKEPMYETTRPALTATSNGIEIKPRSTYRLEVSADDFTPVASIVVAPDIPLVTQCEIDTNTIIQKNPDNTWSSNYTVIGDGSYFPFTIELTDNPAQKNYYWIEVKGLNTDYPGAEVMNTIATTNYSLIQDNPDFEATGGSADIFNASNVTTYAFSKLILTNQTFKGEKKTLNLLLNKYYYELFSRGITSGQLVAYVRQMNAELFKYYRGLVLQDASFDTFTEPVSVPGNIQNGYGCFSVCPAYSKILLEN